MKKSIKFISSKYFKYILFLIIIIPVYYKSLIETFEILRNSAIYNVIYLLVVTAVIVTVSVYKEEIGFYQKSEEVANICTLLICYLHKYSPLTNLIIDIGRDSYNASCLNKSTIRLNGIWIDEAVNQVNNNQIIEYIKCTLLHEVYHLKRNESKLKINMYILFPKICPVPSIRKKMIISNWIEELSADRYAYNMYNDKKQYEDYLKYKKQKLKFNIYSSISHPSWEIRYEFIHNNIPVEYKEVEKRYDKWIKKK